MLRSNALLGSVLYYPSYASFLRWIMELFYLIEIFAYSAAPDAMGKFYYYFPGDFLTCICAVALIAHVIRVLPLLVLFAIET